jgi:hypothetical protein
MFYKSIELKKQWISMNIYYRKTMKLAKMMNSIIGLDDLMKIDPLFWNMVREFDRWMNLYSTTYHYQFFCDSLIDMFNLLVQHIIGIFPDQMKTFNTIDNYPQLKLAIC